MSDLYCLLLTNYISFTWQLQCALIRTSVFELMASYLVLCVSRDMVMDNKYFITFVSVHIMSWATYMYIFTRLQLMKIPHPFVQ